MCIDWWDFIFPWRPLFNAIFLAENSLGLLLKGGETDNKTFWWDYRGAFFHGFLSLGEWSRSGLVNPLRKCENYIRDSHEKRLFCAILVFFTFLLPLVICKDVSYTFFAFATSIGLVQNWLHKKASTCPLPLRPLLHWHSHLVSYKKRVERMEGRGTEPKNNERCCVNKE